jgi:tRNA-modifying protein YgfZ
MAEALKAVGLPNRGVLRVRGDDARTFLDGLVTNAMAGVAPGRAVHAALLTPQGKIIAEFLVTEDDAAGGGGFYLDVPLVAAADLVKRLGFYKLRAKVTIEDLSGELGVVALWGGAPDIADIALAFPDPRLPGLGYRLVAGQGMADEVAAGLGAAGESFETYHVHRAGLGVGEAVFDYPLGDTFPHEINMDQLHGVDFQKGCYVGQEVVSRMQHRGTARTRLVQLAYEGGFDVAEGAPVLAGDRPLGVTGTPFGGKGLAMLRLDRAAEATAAGRPITAGGVPAHVIKPEWWAADWPLP